MGIKEINTSRLAACLPPEALLTIPEVLGVMNEIEPVLVSAGLAHVHHFNHVYKTLTGRVRDGIEQEGRFQQPDTVERTVGIFAQLYFDPLRAYTEGNRAAVSLSWQSLLYNRTAKTAPGGVQFLLGMSSHINYDLPQALCASQVDDSYYPDYEVVIGDMIKAAAEQLSSTYVPVPRMMRDRLTNHTVRQIAHWREVAWYAGKVLQEAHGDDQAIAKMHREIDRATTRKNLLLLHGGSMVMRPLVLPERIRRDIPRSTL